MEVPPQTDLYALILFKEIMNWFSELHQDKVLATDLYGEVKYICGELLSPECMLAETV